MKFNDHNIHILGQDEKNFWLFWDKHLPLFYKVAQSIMGTNSPENDIEDCIQESIIYMWYHMGDYDPEKYSLKNWAALIVSSRAKNRTQFYERERRKIEKIQRHMQESMLYITEPEDILIDREMKEQFIKLIKEMTYPASRILELRYVYGYKPKAIAKYMEMSVKQVNNCIYKAKRTLKRRWKYDK